MMSPKLMLRTSSKLPRSGSTTTTAPAGNEPLEIDCARSKGELRTSTARQSSRSGTYRANSKSSSSGMLALPALTLKPLRLAEALPDRSTLMLPKASLDSNSAISKRVPPAWLGVRSSASVASASSLTPEPEPWPPACKPKKPSCAATVRSVTASSMPALADNWSMASENFSPLRSKIKSKPASMSTPTMPVAEVLRATGLSSPKSRLIGVCRSSSAPENRTGMRRSPMAAS